MIKKTFFCLLLLMSIPSFAQVENIMGYLDDGGRTKASNIIKTDVVQILQANIPLIFEHRFNNYLSVQAGFGLLTTSMYHPLFRPIFTEAPFKDDIKGGYSILVQPTIYSNGFESFHMGVPLRYKRYSNQASSFEFAAAVGYQWFKGRNWAFDIEAGVGLNFEKSLDGASYIYNTNIIDPHMGKPFSSRMIIPISFKVGYVL